MKRITKRLNRNSLVAIFGLLVAGVFVVGFAATGVHEKKPSSAYTGHHAKCEAVKAFVNSGRTESTSVKAGETFQAFIKLTNDGTSTWSPNYGFYLGEYNNGNATNTWKASGNTGVGSDVAPGASYNFNFNVTAPSAPGTYPFNWALAIVYQGFVQIPCSGYSITVNGPPGALSVKSSGQSATSIGLSWTAASGANWYQVYRNDHNIADGIKSTTYNDAGLTCNTSYKYQIGAVNDSGLTASNIINVTTSACPAPPSGGGSSGGSGGGSTGGSGGTASGGSGGGSSSGSSSKSKATPASPNIQGSNNTSGGQPDTSPPNKPDGFTASVSDNVAAVQLTWNAAIDASGIGAYQLDRSTDQQNWLPLTSDKTDTNYFDTTPSFGTHYFYRLRAVDTAGNISDYATTDATTQAFAANAFPDKDNTINDSTNNLAVNIPSGSLSEPAQCGVTPNATILPPNLKGQKSVDGPYELVCKNLSGNVITPTGELSISWTTSASARKNVGKITYYGFKEGNWKSLKITSSNKKQRTDQVVLADNTVFTAMGSIKHTPVWVKIILILLLLGAIGAIIFVMLMMRVRRQQKGLYDDYVHKEYGI